MIGLTFDLATTALWCHPPKKRTSKLSLVILMTLAGQKEKPFCLAYTRSCGGRYEKKLQEVTVCELDLSNLKIVILNIPRD